jgi:hypothetical protein
LETMVSGESGEGAIVGRCSMWRVRRTRLLDDGGFGGVQREATSRNSQVQWSVVMRGAVGGGGAAGAVELLFAGDVAGRVWRWLGRLGSDAMQINTLSPG